MHTAGCSAREGVLGLRQALLWVLGRETLRAQPGLWADKDAETQREDPHRSSRRRWAWNLGLLTADPGPFLTEFPAAVAGDRVAGGGCAVARLPCVFTVGVRTMESLAEYCEGSWASSPACASASGPGHVQLPVLYLLSGSVLAGFRRHLLGNRFPHSALKRARFTRGLLRGEHYKG